MSVTLMVVILTIIFAVLFLALRIVHAVERVQVARFTGVDPRLDDHLREDAKRQMKKDKQA